MAEGWLSKVREHNIQRHGVDGVFLLLLEVSANCPLDSSLSLNNDISDTYYEQALC